MPVRYLINEGGEPFDNQELDALASELALLSLAERETFRNENAQAIATHGADQTLIVAGPGTGKSTLFKQRVLFWLQQDGSARILALSFVRKLVADLNADIQNDATLSANQKKQVDTFTLHKYARRIVEQNHGTQEWRFAPHIRIIGQDWKLVVWDDVLLLSGEGDVGQYSWAAFEKQLHDNDFNNSDQWKELKRQYFVLCQFYNAAGFGDLILRAANALTETPALNEHDFFIFDEYQDFNAAEEHLLEKITENATGTLIVGDDDQVLYETLKSGNALLIRALYSDTGMANAMLPFCGRCDFHIASAASHFIKQTDDPNCIYKIYLPMSDAAPSQKIQVVACPTPAGAVDYIRKFIEDHKEAIDKRKEDLVAGNAKDAYLLILSSSKAVNFYKLNDARDELHKLVQSYRTTQITFSEDYFTALNYYSLANYPANNFTFRKVLYYEGFRGDELLSLLSRCLDDGRSLSALDDERIRTALSKALKVRDILDSQAPIAKKVEDLAECIQIAKTTLLRQDLERLAIDKERVEAIEHQEEEEAELEEIAVQQMSAVELMTIVGSKGLSADHVIIIGFDNVNMGWVTVNAFYVAMTRARRSLHMITALKAGGAVLPNEFLNQLPDSSLAFSKYTKGNRAQESFGSRAAFLQYLKSLNAQARRRSRR
jgi:superfamily I DNA/RNA helicase